MKYLFVVVGLLLCTASCLSPEPVPTCTTPKIQLNQLPVSLNERQTFNLNNLFTGFNLDFNVSQEAPDFIYLTGKTQEIKSFDKPQPGLKSYHFEHMGNRWGNTLMTISEVNHVTKIRWGVTSQNGSQSIPELTEEVTVESESTIDCFDAIWARHAHVAIVDCAKKVTFGWRNIFIFVNTTSQTILPNTQENDMFVSFTNISRRRFLTMSKDGYDYLLRAYFADGVDHYHNHNTYFEIWTFNDPLKPRILKVVDRSFLGQDRLSIMDFKPYDGLIFMLDFHSGMTIFDISGSQHVLIDYRYRTDSGFIRMGLYNGHLDNQLIATFANQHGIYEVDFSERLQPRIIAKYNLMQDSYTTQLWVNEEYVIAQVIANVSAVGEITEYEYNSTIVFNRGTRTYLNAYDLFQHSTPNVIIDFQRDRNLLMIMDTEKTKLLQLNTPIMSVYPTKQEHMNKTFDFYITGHSVNEASGRSMICTFSFKFSVVDSNSMSLWPTGITIPTAYYANYPGQLYIPMDRYLLGPNITYGIDERSKNGSFANHWILQQNDTLIDWDKKPSLFRYTFLRQEQYDNIGESDLFLYTQDYQNNTHFARCRTYMGIQNVTCNDDSFVQHINERIVNLTVNRFHYYNGKFVHIAAIVYEDFPNEIFLYDVDASAEEQYFKPIMMPSSYEGRITSIEFIGQFLAVVLRYTKQIAFFDLNQCIDHQEKQCNEIFRIDSIMMDRIGVEYFAPLQVMASDFHPSVLFIQNIDRVIIVSFNLEGPHLLAQVKSPASAVPGIYHWKMAISQDHLILVNPPNVIEEHRLSELYIKRDAPFQRNYPVYNYVIPDNFDLDFSDKGDLIYITAEDTKLPEESNSVILVYRAGLPTVSSFYDVFHLNSKYNELLIDATGNFADYVAVARGSILGMFRQYQVPVIVFEDNTDDYDFNITYTNDPQLEFKYLMQSSVKISNFPESIKPNDTILNNTNVLNDMVDYNPNEKQEINIDDSYWFTGNVINYTLEGEGCDECGKKARVVNHVEDKRDILAEMDMDDYVFTHDGGIVQQFQSMLQLRHNGSISQHIAMPAVLDGENCRNIAHNWMFQFVLSACIHREEQVYLYFTTLNSFKPIVNGPYFSSASALASIQAVGEVLMLADIDENPSRMSREGGIIIYALNHDITDRQIFDELEYFDSTDLAAAQGWTYGDRIFIGNAHLMFTDIVGLYRLAITELRFGVFFVDFRFKRGMRTLEVVNIEFMDFAQQLLKQNLPMPNMAFFEAVTPLNEFYNSIFKHWEIDILVTTRNFHMFQVNCMFDEAGKLVDHRIERVFYRYGFYETSNYVKSFDGYFAVVQKVPFMFEEFLWYSKQVLTVYDSKDKFQFPDEERFYEAGIPASYMLGGLSLPQGRVTFDFNFTFTRNRTDPFRDIGLVVLHSRQGKIREVGISDNFTIILEQGISSTQNAEFVAHNDFTKFRIPLDVVVHGLPGWSIALIVIGSLLVAAGLGYVIFIMFVKKKETKEAEIKKSLLEESAADELSASSSSSEDDQDDSDDDEEQQEEEQLKEEKVTGPQTTTEPETAINRESVGEEGEDEKKEEEGEGEKGEQKEQGEEKEDKEQGEEKKE